MADSANKRSRRNHTPRFKAKVALLGVRGDKTLAELAKEFDVHPTQITEWRQQLVERSAAVFGAETKSESPVDLKARSSRRAC